MKMKMKCYQYQYLLLHLHYFRVYAILPIASRFTRSARRTASAPAATAARAASRSHLPAVAANAAPKMCGKRGASARTHAHWAAVKSSRTHAHWATGHAHVESHTQAEPEPELEFKSSTAGTA